MNDGAVFIRGRNQVLFWLGAVGLFLLFVWVFNGILLPFVLGILIAYLLEPVVEKIESMKVPRWGAALIILAGFFLTLSGILVVVIPLLANELYDLAERAPALIERLWEAALPYTGWLQERFDDSGVDQLKTALQENIGQAFKVSGNLLAGIVSGGQAIVGMAATMVITPIVSFFMIREWKNITGWIDSLIPRDHYETVTGLLRHMDQKLSGFVRGQFLVALCLGLVYATALTIAKLDSGFLIGLTAGLLSLIPLFGSTVGLLVSVVVAWFQEGQIGYVAIIAGIFFAGQFVEGNILTPRILGKSVGLHPLWILFAVMAGASMFGVVGMLLAVPVAAVISVLTVFATACYRESALYRSSRQPISENMKLADLSGKDEDMPQGVQGHE